MWSNPGKAVLSMSLQGSSFQLHVVLLYGFLLPLSHLSDSFKIINSLKQESVPIIKCKALYKFKHVLWKVTVLITSYTFWFSSKQGNKKTGTSNRSAEINIFSPSSCVTPCHLKDNKHNSLARRPEGKKADKWLTVMGSSWGSSWYLEALCKYQKVKIRDRWAVITQLLRSTPEPAWLLPWGSFLVMKQLCYHPTPQENVL